MNLFEMVWPAAKGILTILSVGVVGTLAISICMIVYYYFKQCQLVRKKGEVEDTMLNLMANFAVAIEIIKGDNRDEEVRRLEEARDKFNQAVNTYYSDPNNKPTLQ